MEIKIDFEVTTNPGGECRAITYIAGRHFVESATSWILAERKLIYKVQKFLKVNAPASKVVQI